MFGREGAIPLLRPAVCCAAAQHAAVLVELRTFFRNCSTHANCIVRRIFRFVKIYDCDMLLIRNIRRVLMFLAIKVSNLKCRRSKQGSMKPFNFFQIYFFKTKVLYCSCVIADNWS